MLDSVCWLTKTAAQTPALPVSPVLLQRIRMHQLPATLLNQATRCLPLPANIIRRLTRLFCLISWAIQIWSTLVKSWSLKTTRQPIRHRQHRHQPLQRLLVHIPLKLVIRCLPLHLATVLPAARWLHWTHWAIQTWFMSVKYLKSAQMPRPEVQPVLLQTTL